MQSGVVTEAVSALTPMSVSTSASLDVVRQDHHEVAVTSEDAEFAKWIEDMDAAHADMLALLMPEVPTTQLPSSVSLFSFGTAYEDGSAGLTNASFPTSPTSTRAQAPRTLQPHYGSLERTGSSHSLISMHSSDGSMEERFSKLQASAISLTALEDRLARLQAPMSVASKIVGGSSRHAVALALPK